MAVNDTKVIRARLFARKDTGAKIEIFLLGLADGGRSGSRWLCLMKPAKRVAPGSVLTMLLRDGVLPISSCYIAQSYEAESMPVISSNETVPSSTMVIHDFLFMW